MTMSRTGKQGPWQAVVRCWKAHPRIAQFITYFMVGNLATVVQLVLIPVLQPILGSTSLVNVDLYLFDPIGDPQTMTTVTAVGQTVSGLNPYYVFNFTGGPVNTLVTRTLNGITGSYLTHGGVAYFLATFIPLILSQVVSFFLQRKVTFKSSGNIAWQAMWYFAAFLVITVGGQRPVRNLSALAVQHPGGGHRRSDRGVPPVLYRLLGVLPHYETDFPQPEKGITILSPQKAIGSV